jgi:hypothetical protein
MLTNHATSAGIAALKYALMVLLLFLVNSIIILWKLRHSRLCHNFLSYFFYLSFSSMAHLKRNIFFIRNARGDFFLVINIIMRWQLRYQSFWHIFGRKAFIFFSFFLKFLLFLRGKLFIRIARCDLMRGFLA